MASSKSAHGNTKAAKSMEECASSRIKALYYIMQTVEVSSGEHAVKGRMDVLQNALHRIAEPHEHQRNVGGGEGLEGLYGSVTRTGMQKVLDCLTEKCGLSNSSHFVDVGAGLGRPILHALVHPGVASGYGIELDVIKCQKAETFLERTVLDLSKRIDGLDIPTPLVRCSSVEQVETLDPATHAYSFWEGVPSEGRYAFGKLFAQSLTLQSVAVVQRAMRNPIGEMEEFGFGTLRLEASFPVAMSGSGRSFTAYVFNRMLPPTLPATPAAAEKRRESLDSAETTVELLSAPLAAPQSERKGGEDSDGEALVLHTPLPTQQRRSRLVVERTPGSADRRQMTPQSAGISGKPRRVLLPPKPPRLVEANARQPGPSARLKAEGSKMAKKMAAGAAAEQERQQKPAPGPSQPTRKSTRLAALHALSTGGSPKTKARVQKPPSPAKDTFMEAGGCRRRRALDSGRSR